MKVYVFGNQDLAFDNAAIKVAKKLEGKIENVEFVVVKPNEDLPFIDEKNVIIIDTVQGIEEVKIIEDKDLKKIVLGGSVSAHDFDLGFQLKYLKKLGKIEKITIIGLPLIWGKTKLTDIIRSVQDKLETMIKQEKKY